MARTYTLWTSVLWLLLLHLAAATHRVERDSLGEVQVPEFAYWGSSTQRSIQNFKIGEHRMPHSFLRAFAMQKEACARANHERLSQVSMPPPPEHSCLGRCISSMY